jgi:hypothetical protein
VTEDDEKAQGEEGRASQRPARPIHVAGEGTGVSAVLSTPPPEPPGLSAGTGGQQPIAPLAPR